YSRLFSSNVAPEPVEVTTIQEDIDARTKTTDQLEVEVQRLDAEHQRIEMEWQKVCGERDKLATERETLRGLLTSFRRFPAEILSEIFIAVHSDSKFMPRWGPAQVVTLSRVSTLWRDVALSTPRLWNCLALRPMDLTRCDISKISRWMGRSGSTARWLELRDLDACHQSHENGRASHCLLIELWKVVKLLSEGPFLHALCLNDIFTDCLQVLAEHMAAQQTRDARPWDSLGSLSVSLAMMWGAESPTLAETLFIYLQVPIGGGWTQFPDHNSMLECLTSLGVDALPASSLSSLSALCPQLTELSMRLYSTVDGFPSRRQPQRFPNLRTLRLDGWMHSQVALLPRLLLTPSLVQLDLKFASVQDDDSDSDDDGSGHDEEGSDNESQDKQPTLYRRFELVTGLTSFVQQSEVGVQRLRIENLWISSRGLERILMNIPSVTDLAFHNVQMDATLFQRTSHLVSDHHMRLVPRLETLRLSDMKVPLEFLSEGVCNFFARRITYPPKFETIKSLYLEVDDRALQRYDFNPENAFRNAISRLRKLGVDVHVRLEA
ncbi:hypothetical protein FA13DRAFT_1734241, partial [Coprinellus micaceus]